MSDKQITVNGADQLAKETGLSLTKAQEIMLGYAEHAQELGSHEDAFKKIIEASKKEITPELCAEAKALRLKLVKVRTGSDKTHKAMKADTLLVSRAIDGAKNILQLQIKERENPLMDIEKHFEKIEAEKKQAIANERRDQLLKYGWEDNGTMDLINMTDELFDGFLEGLKAKQAAAEAETKAKEEAIKKRQIELELEQKRIEYIDANTLRYFIDQENLVDLGSMAEEDYEKVIQQAQEAKIKKAEEDAALAAENERLAAEAKKKEAEDAEKERAAQMEREIQIAKTAETRKAEIKKFDIENFIAVSLTEDDTKLGSLSEDEWIKERDEAIKQGEDKKAMQIEKDKKNKQYKDWLAKNDVTVEQLEKGEYVIDIKTVAGKTEFTLSKVISKITI